MTGRMREVELVEAGGEPVPARAAITSSRALTPLEPEEPPEPGDDHVVTARAWLRRHAIWLVPTAAVAVLALVGTQLVLDARERTRLAELAAIPGVVPPTGPDIGVIWRADPSLATVMQGGTAVGGLMIGGKASTDGAVDLVALDTDTGAVAWTTPVHPPDAHVTPSGSPPSTWVGCSPVQHGDRALAACVSQQYGEDIVGLPASSAWVVDAADGAVVSQAEIPGGAGVAFTDDAMVVATRIDDADDGAARTDAGSVRWRATATDLLSGAPLWTYTTPVTDVLGREDGPEAANATGSANLQTFGDRMILAVDNHAWILRTDGSLVRDIALEPGSWLQAARAGVFIESSYTSGNTYTGTLLLADGTEVPIQETAGYLSVDDGSAPDVVLTVGQGPASISGLSARDATTGKVLWHRNDAVVAGLLLHGTLYYATEDSLQAVDATTGRTRWSAHLDFQPQQLSTDGRYLLVPGLAVSLQAYALGDGRLSWHKDLLAAAAGNRSEVFVQGFQSSGRDPRLFIWMDDGAVAVLG